MTCIQHELRRIQSVLTENQLPAKYSELYAAQQALDWMLDPTMFMAPFDMLASGGTQGGLGDSSAGNCRSEFSDTLDHHAASQSPKQTFLAQPPNRPACLA